MPGQDVVGQSKPAQHRADLFEAADGELVQTPVSKAGVDAFGADAAFVNALAMWAVHTCSPSGHARPIVTARGIRIAQVLAAAGRAIDFDAVAGGPFGILILVEAAVDQVALRPSAIALSYLIQRRPDQATIGADGFRFRRDHDLAAGRAGDLAIVGWPKAAIGHFHDAGLGIGVAGARLGLLGNLLLLGLGAPLALRLALTQLLARRRHPAL